ncbi:MAG: hypothetical protein ABSH50_19090 [Bryobacteraceae bacterium]
MSKKLTDQKPVDVLADSPESRRARVTFLLPEALDRNLEMYCISFGKKKSDVAQKAFVEFLKKEGIAAPGTDQSEAVQLALKGKAN